MAFERCHDPEELQRLSVSGGLSALLDGGSRSAATTPDWATGRRLDVDRGQDVGGDRCPTPTHTRSATSGGNLVSGTLVADNEALVLAAAARDRASRRSRSASRSRGLNIEIDLQRTKVKLKELVGLLAAVRDDGELGPADPARARRSWPTRPRTRSSPTVLIGVSRTDVEQGSSLSGAMAEAPEGRSTTCSSSMVKSGETGGSLDDVLLLRLADMIESEVQAARQDQVGDDLPDRGRRARDR